MLRKSIGFNSFVLAAFALITATLLAGTYLGTRDKIAESERHAAEKALLEIIPKDRHSNDMLLDTIAIPRKFWGALGLKQGGELNIARQAGKIEALIIPAIAPDGYSGDIRLITGVNMDGTVAGVRVLTHSETTGLGDKIDIKKSDWILNFNHKSLSQPVISRWRVKKDGGDFDQFTGATITPRAVVAQVKRILEYFVQDQKRIVEMSGHIPSPSPKPGLESTPHETISTTDKKPVQVAPEIAPEQASDKGQDNE